MSQQGSSPQFNVYGADTPPPYVFSTQVIVGAVIVLFVVIFVVLMIHVYARWFLRRSSGSYAISRGVARPNTGLDKAVIAQLPTFVYTAAFPLDKSETGKLDESVSTMPTVPECAICLSEFQENEKGRMLPSCKHIFHTECIDMWFFSHSTCPICRADVIPGLANSETIAADQQHQDQEAMGASEGTTEGNSVASRAVSLPYNVVLLQEPSTSALPVSASSLMAGARASPQITIDISSIEGNQLVSPVGWLSTKSTMEQEAGTSQPLKSPSLRASIKRMLSSRSSRHRSFRQEDSEESPK